MTLKKDYNPRMHSAEHILNQTMVRLYDCGRSFNAHIEKKKSKCDYRLEKAPKETEVADIERRVNDVIDMNLPVGEAFVSREEAEARYSLSKLPGDAGDNLRIVTIGDYDACPCIGPHVASTGEIGSFRIVSTNYDDGVFRIRFKLGTPQERS
jgi:misacylated tRNA(Ala) deacylase